MPIMQGKNIFNQYANRACLITRKLINFKMLAASVLLLNTVNTSFANIKLDDCFITDTSGYKRTTAKCHYFSVPENHAAPDDKQIKLLIAKIPAKTQNPAPDPLLILTGGPGQAATETYVSLENFFSGILKKRDIILVDQRGTGKSNAQHCPSLTPNLLADPKAIDLKKLTKQCLQKLTGNPKYYTTSVAIRDLDILRNILNYKTWNIYGISYGTRVALQYLRVYPEQVRSVVLDGVVPPKLILGPDVAIYAQQALNNIFDRCKQHSNCSTQFPNLYQGFAQILQQLDKKPITINIDDPNTGKQTPILLSHTDIIGTIRLLSYSTEGASIIPAILYAAYAKGNFVPLAKQKLLQYTHETKVMSSGMHNSVICSEDVPFYKESRLKQNQLKKTYMGEFMINGLIDVCEDWPQGIVDQGFRTQFTSNKPVLLLSGSNDPITPPKYAEDTMKYLNNSRHIIGKDQGHGMIRVGCTAKLIKKFIETGEHKSLDDSCLDIQQADPFFIDFYGPEP